MRKNLMWIAGVCLLAAGLLASCSSTTMIAQWTDPSYTGGKMQKVLLLGVSPNLSGRRIFEDSFAQVLAKRKVQTVSSYQQFPEVDAITKEAIESFAKEQGITHILVARIADRQTVQEYVPPSVTTAYSPSYPGYYGGWYPYYSTSYATVVTPGYTYERTIVTVETNIYDVATTKMIWNGMSDTEIGSTVQANLLDYIDTVAQYIARAKLI